MVILVDKVSGEHGAYYLFIYLCTVSSLEEFGNVQEETFQQPRSNECQLNVSSQGLDEGLSPPSKPQELDILSSVPQEDKINTVTNTSGELTIILVHVPTSD